MSSHTKEELRLAAEAISKAIKIFAFSPD